MSFNDDLTGIVLKHTCILAVTENNLSSDEVKRSMKLNNSAISKSGIVKRTKCVANTDENFYRKVSKYELDNNTVNWKEYHAER